MSKISKIQHEWYFYPDHKCPYCGSPLDRSEVETQYLCQKPRCATEVIVHLNGNIHVSHASANKPVSRETWNTFEPRTLRMT